MSATKGSKKKWIWISVSVILILLLAGVGYGAYLYHKTASMVDESHETSRDEEQSALRDETVDPVTDNVSVLFLGVDTGEERGDEENSRTDAILLATFNKDEGTVKLLSIPRDTYTYIPEVGYSTKINHAHSYGGPRATMETVENYLHIPIDYYVRLNFEAFIDIVDALNGISYNVPFEIVEMDSKDKKDAIHLSPGYQTLNGEEALALVRTRKYDSDVERGKRQQEVIRTIAKKLTSASTVFKLNELIDAVGPNMRTDLSFNQMKSFFAYGLDRNFDIERINLDGDGDYMEDGVWYFHANEESLAHVQQDLRDHLDLSTYGIDGDENDIEDSSYEEDNLDDNENDGFYEEHKLDIHDFHDDHVETTSSLDERFFEKLDESSNKKLINSDIFQFAEGGAS